MSGPAIGRTALEAEEKASLDKLAELAQAEAQLEQSLINCRTEKTKEIGSLTTLRRILGKETTPEALAAEAKALAEAAPKSKPRRRRAPRKTPQKKKA